MQIKSIELKNFMIHKELKCDFTRGLNAVVGDNGTGKTSLLNALFLTLFGFKSGRYRTKEEYINDEARSAGKDMLVRIVFEHPAVGEVVTRLTTRKMEVMTGDGEVYTGAEARRVLAGLVGMNREAFMTTAFCAQGEVARLLHMPPADREKEMVKMLGLTAPRRFVDKLAELRTAYRKTFDTGETTQSVANEIRTVVDEVAQHVDKYEELMKEAAEVEKHLQEARKELDRIVQLYSASERLKQVRVNLQQIKPAYDRYRQLSARGLDDEIRTAERELQTIEATVKELEQKKSELMSQATLVQKSYEEVVEATQRLKEINPDEVRSQYQSIMSEIDRLQKEVAHAEAEVATLHDRLHALETGSGDKCPVCGGKLTERKRERLINEFKGRIEELHSLIDGNRKKLSSLENDKLKYEATLKSIELSEMVIKQHGPLEELERKRCQLKEQYNTVVSQLREANSRRNEAIKRLTMLRSERDELKRLASQYKMYTLLMQEYEQLMQQLSDVKDISTLEEEYVNANEKVQFYEEKLNEINRELSGIRGHVLSGINMYNNLYKRYASLVKNNIKYEFLTHLRDATQLYVRRYTSEIVRILPDRVNTIISAFGFSYRFGIDEDLNMYVISPSGEKKDMSYPSGGQQVVLGLALRVALARILGGGTAPILILDEPTLGLSHSRVENLAQFLKGLTDMGLVNQIVIVTHERLFEETADNLIKLGAGAGRLEQSVSSEQDKDMQVHKRRRRSDVCIT